MTPHGVSYCDNDIYWDDPAMEEPVRGHDMLKDFALSFWSLSIGDIPNIKGRLRIVTPALFMFFVFI